MAAEIYMPKNGMDMTEGTLVRWLKREGDPVEAGEPVMEIETDKVTMEAEAPASGVLLQRLYPDGAVVPVLETVGYIGRPGEGLPEGGPSQAAGPAPQGEAPGAAAGPGYRVAVIGGGPAGYVAAIRAAQLGARTVLFEKDAVGGTCLNRGCIPTKALLKTASHLRHIRHAADFGIRLSGAAEADLPAVMARKDRVVKTLTGGVAALLRSYGVEVVRGEASLLSEREIACGGSVYSAENIILCGGSVPVRPPIPGAEYALTSTELLNLRELPRSLCVVGGGVIGCELACAFRAFGAEVSVVEQTDRLAPAMDPEVSAEIRRAMEDDGVTLHLHESVRRILRRDGGLTVVTDGSELPCDAVLLSAGRAPSLECLGRLRDRLRTEGGRVVVDGAMRTSVNNIYACGDINGRAMLAHAAFKMGETAAENCVTGAARPCPLNAVPSVLYTLPEAASVGLTEPQARAQCPSGVLVGRFPLSANGRSVAAGETAGFVKVVADRATGELLGVHIVGEAASEMIAEPAALMAAEVTVHEIASRLIHAHPSCAEAFAEACADALGVCVHLPAKKA